MAMIVRGCDAMCLFVLSGTWALILRAVSSLAVNRTWWPKAARLHTVRRRGGHKGNRPAIGETRCASYGHRPRDIVDMLPQPGRNRWLMAAYRVLHCRIRRARKELAHGDTDRGQTVEAHHLRRAMNVRVGIVPWCLTTVVAQTAGGGIDDGVLRHSGPRVGFQFHLLVIGGGAG